ncbi:hypothetical protein G9G63_09445 [Paenibacillus sp. EKM202P]|uniref:hypothetical protein n=1 Tax=unclassified Paenibacillus TaxID=185978 RepID=UPI0013EC0C4C|nr:MULTISPECIES: hypothetical protein [unclassified Paenibacillus]KAF6565373.1 hypothetical protein G9G63_09445 [Paenibacillus sp. EKM202P]KAF6569302.1 hypothetical protein G9G64_12650 [Paenibacillus sp. EKM207P]
MGRAWNLVVEEIKKKYIKQVVSLMGIEGIVDNIDDDGVTVVWSPDCDDCFLKGTVTYPNVSVSLKQLRLVK